MAPGSRGQAVVVGAGPAGVVAAMFLARQGFGVEVVERRGDPTAPEAEEANKQTFIMALMPRGTAPLRNVSSTAAGMLLPVQLRKLCCPALSTCSSSSGASRRVMCSSGNADMPTLLLASQLGVRLPEGAWINGLAPAKVRTRPAAEELDSRLHSITTR